MHCVYFPPEVGGLESHVYYLCRALVERGHRVSVVTSRSMKGLPERESLDGIDVWRTWMPSRNPVGWTLHAALSTPRLGQLARGADVIHAQAMQSVLPGYVAKRAAGVPLVATWHTSHFLKRAESPFWRPIFQKLIEWTDYNLAASQEIAGVAEGIAPGVSVEALPNGVETSLFRRTAASITPGERVRIMVPRRLYEKNGVEFFVRAMPLIVEQVDAEAVIIGDGPERATLENLARELRMGDRIRFLGTRPNAEMPGLLSSGRVAVFPSLVEATSIAALEAMACELPVAASRVGGLPEIVDDTVGALFEPENPTDLAKAVIGLLSRDDLDGLGARARERVVSRWSNARLTDRHLEIYQAVLDGHRRRAA